MTGASDARLAIVLHADRLRVLVVGGGAVAERKAFAFVEHGARVRVIAPRATAAIRDAAARGALDLTLRGYEHGDVAAVEIVVAATDERAVNAAVAADARAAHRLCNVADAPDDGTFSSMAQRAHGALLVAVSASGVPAAAARVLDAIMSRYDARYGEAIGALRELRRRLLDAGDRAGWDRASARLIDDDFLLRVENGGVARDAREWR